MTPSHVGPADLERARVVGLECAEIALRVMRETARGEIRSKAHAADLVTDVDVATEVAVRQRLAEAFPDHAIVGEELGGVSDVTSTRPTWYCDPVDGTTNLAAGLPWTSFSLALAVGRRPLVGVVADPWRGEVWHAVAGRGAVRRDAAGRVEPSRVASRDTLAGAVVLTEWAAHVPWPGMLELLSALGERMCTSRVMGSGTLTVTSVGAGRCAGAVIGEFHPEDHLAAVLIAREAGAVVRDAHGDSSGWPDAGPFVVAAPGVVDELDALVRRWPSHDSERPLPD